MLRTVSDPVPAPGPAGEAAPAPLPGRILMTVDAVGGVWRYAVDAAAALNALGIGVVLAGLGPQADAARRREVARLPATDLVWLDAPLDWLTREERALDALPDALARLADDHAVDLLHLNAPTQAAGLSARRPTVVVSHSCVVTWWTAVRGGPLPAEWRWQARRNRTGLDAADLVVVPSEAHGRAVEAAYGPVDGLAVVPNAVRPVPPARRRRPVVLAAGRWWDEGKNGAVLDVAAAALSWPVELAGATRGPNGATLAIRHAAALGELSGAALRRRMRSAAIVACPSRYEPFGLAALEAASAGAALVLSDTPTFREIWSDAALFADPQDPEAWIHAIGWLIARPRARDALAAAARSRAAAFTPARQAERLAAVYVAATARHAARRQET